MITRRGFITGLTALISAPAIVRVTSIMPVRVLDPEYKSILEFEYETLAKAMNESLYGSGGLNTDLVAVMRKAFVPRLMTQVWDQSPLLKYAEQA